MNVISQLSARPVAETSGSWVLAIVDSGGGLHLQGATFWAGGSRPICIVTGGRDVIEVTYRGRSYFALPDETRAVGAAPGAPACGRRAPGPRRAPVRRPPDGPGRATVRTGTSGFSGKRRYVGWSGRSLSGLAIPLRFSLRFRRVRPRDAPSAGGRHRAVRGRGRRPRHRAAGGRHEVGEGIGVEEVPQESGASSASDRPRAA